MALALHSCGSLGTFNEVELASASALPDEIVWVDLMQATDAEIAFVERATGLHVPTHAELSEIESSSRLRLEHGVFYLSTPAVFRNESGQPITTPVGYVLCPKRLITVRFAPLPAFDTFTSEVKKPDNIHPSSAGVFVGLLETVVDRLADVLEQVGGDLDKASHFVFSDRRKIKKEEVGSTRAENALRDIVRDIGRAGDLVSKIRDSLMGIGRIAPYVAGRGVDWMPADMKPAFETLRQDIASLNDYDAYLTGKIQFLLDATLGLINIEQNDIIKILTVATVVALAPTFLASWYGMNFKNIPEYDWSFGYIYAIAVLLITSIGPLIWFKKRGWF